MVSPDSVLQESWGYVVPSSCGDVIPFNKSHVSAVVWGSGDATMELGVNVACVTHASLVGAMVCGYQILMAREALSRTILREVRNKEDASASDN
jgi:hypothetical protein